MKEHLGAIALVALVPLASVLVGTVKTKALALALSTSSFGAFGLMLAFQNAAGGVLSLGLAPALTRAIAAEGGEKNPRAVLGLLLVSTGVLAIVSTIATVLMVLNRQRLSLLVGGTAQADLLGWAVLALPFLLVGSLFAFAIQGLQAVQAFAISGTLTAILSGMLVATGGWFGGLEGAVLGTVAGAVCSAAIYGAGLLWLLARASSLSRQTLWPQTGDLVRARTLAPVAAAVFMTTMLTAADPYALRFVVSHIAGLEATGLFHGAASMSFALLTAATAAVSWYVFPRMSRAGTQTQELEYAQALALRLGLQVLLPLTIGLVIARDALTHLLLAPGLAAASNLLPGMVIGEFVYFTQWTIFASLLAAQHLRAFVAMAALRTALIVMLTIVGVSTYGVAATPWAYAASGLVALGAGALYQWRTLKIRMPRENVNGLLGGLAALTLITLATTAIRLPDMVAVPIAAAAVVLAFRRIAGLLSDRSGALGVVP